MGGGEQAWVESQAPPSSNGAHPPVAEEQQGLGEPAASDASPAPMLGMAP